MTLAAFVSFCATAHLYPTASYSFPERKNMHLPAEVLLKTSRMALISYSKFHFKLERVQTA